MERQSISLEKLALPPFTTLGAEGVLLVAGDATRANPMTISWGMFGIMWGRPVVMAMVRPTRYTWEFITECPDFTVNWLPEAMTPALRLCGSKSGRDLDKFAAAGLTPVPSTQVACPALAEAELVLECRTRYTDDLKPERFLDPALLTLYRDDFHGLFFGEVLAAQGIDRRDVTE